MIFPELYRIKSYLIIWKLLNELEKKEILIFIKEILHNITKFFQIRHVQSKVFQI